MHASPSPYPSQSTRLSTWVAALMLVALGFIQLYYCDLTFHGPDQIRDMDTVRLWLHQGQWPHNSTPFNGRLYLPPGFYYLLALPLLVADSEISIFIAFGLFYVACIAYTWHTLRRHLGERAALAYLVLAMPIFSSVYTHSAWNPALVIGLSSLVLALWIQTLHQPRQGWFALVLVMFVLVQVHPSAAPLGVALGLYALVHPAVLKHRATLASMGIVLTLTAVWAVLAQPWNAPRIVSAPPPPAPGGWSALPARLLDASKWWDALAMPYRMIDGISPAIPVVTAAAAILLGVMLVGVVLGLVYAVRTRTMRWVALALVLWWVLAMTFLSHGGFWHLDVIQPWLAVMAAYGWTRVSEQWSCPNAPWLWGTAAVGVLALGGQVGLYRHFEAHGKIDVAANTSFFPRIQDVERQIPSFSYRYLHAMQTYLQTEGICQNQLRGQHWMLARDMTNRQFDARCREAPGLPPATQYLIEPTHPAGPWELTRGLIPVATLPAAAVYALPSLPMRINGQEGGNVFADEKADYMTFLPARHNQGIEIQLSTEGPTVLHVSLRCTDETILRLPDSWTLTHATSIAPPRASQVKYMGSNYYTFEWTLHPTQAYTPITLATPAVLTNCDVSAAARLLKA